jgi:hypothetical protein
MQKVVVHMNFSWKQSHPGSVASLSDSTPRRGVIDAAYDLRVRERVCDSHFGGTNTEDLELRMELAIVLNGDDTWF